MMFQNFDLWTVHLELIYPPYICDSDVNEMRNDTIERMLKPNNYVIKRYRRNIRLTYYFNKLDDKRYDAIKNILKDMINMYWYHIVYHNYPRPHHYYRDGRKLDLEESIKQAYLNKIKPLEYFDDFIDDIQTDLF